MNVAGPEGCDGMVSEKRDIREKGRREIGGPEGYVNNKYEELMRN